MHEPVSKAMSDADWFKSRAAAEIQLAKAAGARKAEASADNRTVFIERPDGTKETVRLRRAQNN